MSWIQELYTTYNNCLSSVGYSNNTGERPLLPICHVTAQAHIEVIIDEKSNFRNAHVISDKKHAITIVPSTEGSASRTGKKPENHPLCDKLQYVAGDFLLHGGMVTSGFAKDPEEPYRNFIDSLARWCASEFAHPKAEAILKYVKKKTVIEDLVGNKILFVSSTGQFLSKNEIEREKNASDIFSVINAQEDAFVRWIVETQGVLETKVWKDKTLWDSWIDFYLSTKKKEPICYVTGKETILTANHPKYIRREGDGAKLISSNDTSGFTFRGRFLTDQEACTLGLEVSHKSHYALAWLISRQGYRSGDLAIVAWATSGAPVPQPTDDALSILGYENLPTDLEPMASTAQEVAIRLKKRIAGYGKNIGDTTDINVIGLDSATTGRLAISFYRKLTGSDFINRIDAWHESCAWLHRYRFVDVQEEKSGKTIKKLFPFIGAPAPSDIAQAAYGSRLDGKLRKATIERILPCIIDGQTIPYDLVTSTVRRASSRSGMEEWEWNKTLSIGCALYKKFREKENYDMALDFDRKTRDYLYGRLLALAESLEQWALSEANEKRETNAARLMQRFAERPFSTWKTIELALSPSKVRLGGKSYKRQQMIDEVVAAFDENDFLSDKPLSGEFLLGYHCQREFLRPSRAQQQDESDNSEPSDINE